MLFLELKIFVLKLSIIEVKSLENKINLLNVIEPY